jgi:hypothetical protein
MALLLSDISAVLKEVVPQVVYDQLSNINILFQKVRSDSSIIDTNNNIYLPARTGRHSGIYSVAENTNPRVGKSKRQRMSSAIKFTFGTLEITDQTLTAAKRGDKKAVVPILEDEIISLTETFEKDINRQWFGDGTGQLCVTNGSGSSSTTLTVDTPGTEYLIEGMYIEIVDSGAAEISSVDSSTQVTLSSALSWSDDEAVTKENATSSDASEMMGLKGIIDDGDFVSTFQGLARASNTWLNAHTDDTAEALTEADMITQFLNAKKFASKIDKKTGEMKNKLVIFMGQTLFEKYGSLLTSLKRTRDLQEVLSGGWKGLEFMGGDAAVMLEYDCPAGFVFITDLTSLVRAEMSNPFEWLDGEGERGILTRSPDNRTIWEATMKYYANLVCTKPQANARLSGKTA